MPRAKKKPKRRRSAARKPPARPRQRKPRWSDVPAPWRADLRHLAKLTRYDPVKTAAPGMWFDAEAAGLAVEFFPGVLVHVKGPLAGKPFELVRWQRAVVANLFGWKRPDGLRRYRKAFVYVAKKNGKTTLAAGLLLCVMCIDGEAGQENYSCASSRDQAALVFMCAAGMVRAEAELGERFRVYGDRGGSVTKAIVDKSDPLTSYKCLAADEGTADGVNPHLLIVDEDHRHKRPDVADILEKSQAARAQPLSVHITTADIERENSLANREHDYAAGVASGAIPDPSHFPVLFEAGKDDDWTDPKVWRRANPNLNVTIAEEFLARECGKAKRDPHLENDFKRFHLNVRTQQTTRWLSIEAWDACAHLAARETPLAWRERVLRELEGAGCVGGLDLGSTSDLTALVLWFPRADGPDVVVPWFWCPVEGAGAKDAQHRALYETWIDAGWITATRGNVADYDEIRAQISGVHEGKRVGRGLADRFGVREIAVDRVFQGAHLCTQLLGDGLAVLGFGQGFLTMAAPAKEFGERVLKAAFAHGANPVLRWMASNVEVASDPAGNIKPVKPKRGSPLKVDGIVSAIMALGRIMADPSDSSSVYEQRGLIVL